MLRACLWSNDKFLVSGGLVPDVTGLYLPVGTHNGKPYYEPEGNAVFIWWNGADSWLISTVLGVPGVAGWIQIDPETSGTYNPYGTAAGIATVTNA